MKTLSAELAAHYAAGTTTLCTIWHITRRDGTVYRFTDLDIDLVVDGQTYLASGGYSASAIESNAELSVDNLEVQGFLDSELITDSDISSGLWDHAAVKIGYVNWQHPEYGVDWQRSGWLGEVTTAQQDYKAELRGLAQPLQQTIGEVFGSTCAASLGDARCGKNLAAFTFAGTVTGVTSRRLFAADALTQANGYFEYGLLTWTGGLNDGLSAEVKTYVVGAVTLQLPMPYSVQAGDTFSVVAGCGKRLQEDCKTKFNNVVNFRGFPYIPGADQIMKGPA